MVRRALAKLERDESDLKLDLTVEGLETQKALDFVRKIPTVSELVPLSRFDQIVQQFAGELPPELDT